MSPELLEADELGRTLQERNRRRYTSAAALSLVTTALIVAGYQRVLPREVGDTVGHQAFGDRLEGFGPAGVR